MASYPREVELPVGYADSDGTWRRSTRIRKMSGHEEALLYDASLSSGQLISHLVASCLRRDDETEVAPATVAGMYSADRNYLLMEIRRFTLGDALPCAYVCPACGSDVGIVEDLSRISVRRCAGDGPPRPARLTLEDGYRDRDGVHHAEITLRLPRGEDEEFVAATADRDPLRARDVLILRCIESFGTLTRATLEAYGIRILRDLTLGDRTLIYRALDGEAPGIDLHRSVKCPHCGKRFEATLDAASFFLAA